ncbi:MAG: NACHT domain-containing protein [Methanosarcinales archaeon]
MQKHKKLVIIGGPGTGKTTLISYLTLNSAKKEAKKKLRLDQERLPILINLRDLKDQLPSADNFQDFCIPEHCPEGFFEEHLKNGDCIVLLDGLDEVANKEQRNRIAKWTEGLVATYPNNYYVVTSRPSGYETTYLNGFNEQNIIDFQKEDVENFARKWCKAVEVALNGENEVAYRNAEKESKKLINAIEKKDRIKKLVVNPLILTIVALVHRYRAQLPERRVELYDECTFVLLGGWDTAKGIVGELDPAEKKVF